MLVFLLVSFIGYAFSVILMDDVFFFWKKFLFSGKVPEWLAKPLGACPVCFTGQLTLWTSIWYVNWNFVDLVVWLSVISINMIITIILMKYVKGD